MCDTQVLVTGDGVWLAKNSDREPGEPQPVIRLPRVRNDPRPHLRATYVEIDQVPDRHALIVSKPGWIWGAEMGVNERGVAIGNEAVFTRRRSCEPALLGMDLVRLGLERGASACEALDVITDLLQRHGQGGPAGHRDKRFCYDNSFLIADPQEAWVLETAGRSWAARRIERSWAISNALTLGDDYDLCSEDLAGRRIDFARRFDTRLMPWLAGARRRRATGLACLAEVPDGAGPERWFGHLRAAGGVPDGDHDPIACGNGDVCLHAAGPVRRSQTTGSMVARLDGEGPQAWFTATSAPCLSLFRPVVFDEGPWTALTPLSREPYAERWRAHERVHRRALFDAGLRAAVREDLRATERAMLAAANLREADAQARDWDARQATRIADLPLEPPNTRAGRFWRRQNRRDGID